MSAKSKLVFIEEIYYSDLERLAELGFTTDYQIKAVMALSDVMSQIRDMKEDFNFMTFLIKQKDLLNHRPC